MPAPSPAVVVFVSDVERVSAFYREVASMQILVQDHSHCVLATDGFQVTVHALRGEPGVRPNAQGEPPLRQDSYLKLCLPVHSIAAARAVAERYGGAIKAPDSEWAARGFRACDGHDPEGNVIQVRESAAVEGEAAS